MPDVPIDVLEVLLREYLADQTAVITRCDSANGSPWNER